MTRLAALVGTPDTDLRGLATPIALCSNQLVDLCVVCGGAIMADGARESQNVVPTVTGQAALAEVGQLILPEAGKLNVFISYSRDDLAFADQLDVALALYGFATTLDRHGISGGEDWKPQLGRLIRDADTVAFVLSPSSARSDICAWEVAEAVKLGKRILPVLCGALANARPPPQLADLNYIYFYDEPKSPGSGFGAGLVRLVAALNTDLAWLREHTRLLQRASEWEAAGRPENRLLFGDVIANAKAWAAKVPKNAPAPTGLHMEFIRASEEEAARRRSAEHQRLEQMAEAQTAREAALKDKEIAQKLEAEAARREAEAARRAAEAAKRVIRVTRIGLAAALVLLAVAGAAALGWRAQQKEALAQRTEAVAQRTEALAQTARADVTRDEALLAQSKALALFSEQQTEVEKNPTVGLLLALEALPDVLPDGKWAPNRQYWSQVEVSLEGARRALRELRVLKGHDGGVSSMAISPDGTRIVTGSWDNTARIWDAATGAELRVLKGHEGWVYSVAISPDGTRIVTGSEDNTARIWDAATGAELHVLEGHGGTISSVAVSPDGTRIVTGSYDNTARIWDATGAELRVLKGHDRTSKVYSVAFSSDGTRIVTGSNDSTARIWDAATGAELRVLKGHEATVTSVAVSPDSTRIITGAEDNTARIWDAATGTELRVLKGHVDTVSSVAVSPDGTHIVTGSGDKTARIWDAATGAELRVLKGHDGPVYSVAVSPNGTRIVTGSEDNTARIWDAANGAELRVLKGHNGAVRSVAVSPDGTRIVTGSYDSTARIWDAATGVELRVLDGRNVAVFSVAVSPDGTRIVTGSYDNTARIWDAATGAELRVLKVHDRRFRVFSVAVSPDGTRIVTGSGDGTARVWDAATGAELRELKGHGDTVRSVAVSPDGTRIVTGSEDRTARVWDTATGAELHVLKGHGGTVHSVAVSPDGARIVTGSEDNTARIWDAATGAELHVLKGHDGAVYSVTVSPDATSIVTGSFDNTARVWDAATGAELHVLKGHDGPVYSVAVSPNGTRIVTGSSDNTTRVWPLYPSGPLLVAHTKDVAARCLTPAERHRFFLTTAPPRWCGTMAKWPYDAVGGLIEGERLMSAAKDDEAEVIFQTVLANDPSLANKIEAVWTRPYIDRGTKLLKVAKDDEAKTQFDLALKRDPGLVNEIDAVWADAYVNRGRILLVFARNDEAKAQFELALKRDPTVASRIDATWANAFVDRGSKLLAQSKADEAKVQFALALSKDPKGAASIAKAYISFGNEGLDNRSSNASVGPADALRAFEEAQAWARRGETNPAILADAIFGRGRAYEAQKQYSDAVSDFREAARLGHKDADARAWSATNRLGDQLRDQGKPIEGLLLVWTNLLDVSPQLRKSIGLQALKSNAAFGYIIGRLNAELRIAQSPVGVTQCDHLTSHHFDPYRVAGGILIDAIEAKPAIAACDQAVKDQPVEPRFLYMRGRAHSRAARLLATANDDVGSKASYAVAFADYEAAMAKGYPMAFNNMANAFQNGDGVEKDADKAADLYLQSLNRTLGCCWVPVGRHLLDHEAEFDSIKVRRVVREVSLWAAALGSVPARDLLAELTAKGMIAPATLQPAATFADLPPWLRE